MLHGRNRIVDDLIEIDDGHPSLMQDIFNRSTQNSSKELLDDSAKLERITKKYKKMFKQSPCLDRNRQKLLSGKTKCSDNLGEEMKTFKGNELNHDESKVINIDEDVKNKNNWISNYLDLNKKNSRASLDKN